MLSLLSSSLSTTTVWHRVITRTNISALKVIPPWFTTSTSFPSDFTLISPTTNCRLGWKANGLGPLLFSSTPSCVVASVSLSSRGLTFCTGAPKIMPSTEHLLNRITFCVRVPVLSEKMYCTWPRSVTFVLLAIALVSVLGSYMLRSTCTSQRQKKLTISRVTYMLRGTKLLRSVTNMRKFWRMLLVVLTHFGGGNSFGR
mmetsp:Transcript_11965/g.23765  ORF Transcript_11965/g.23765 Transcript_11965/m.23765 type:complete len:200 (+) Transcript_11965:5213-5812(+)